jgi:hypothetical protein
MTVAPSGTSARAAAADGMNLSIMGRGSGAGAL